jgi:hypothetical protein
MVGGLAPQEMILDFGWHILVSNFQLFPDVILSRKG